MTTRTVEIWECDRCNTTVQLGKGSAPKRWINVVLSADTGLDIERGNAPSEHILCESCAKEIRVWLTPKPKWA